MPRTPPSTEVIRCEDRSEVLVVQRATVQVTAGADEGREVELRGGALVVGSDPGCDLVLDDPSVSGRQLEIHAAPGGFLLRDLGSTNGTFVGGVRVIEAILSGPTAIRAGRTHLHFAPHEDRETFPLSRHHRFGQLLGRSPAMRRCFALLEKAAETDSTVLIEGESGTGKELAAEAIHERSARADGPLVVVDCGAISASLIESELFGHVKGAFTDAAQARAGAFERADGGTLFLDEIGELEVGLQPKLLRFLEKRQTQRVGGDRPRPVDVRVVAATNRRLDDLVAAGTFRQDLFYRLAVIRVEMPPLRRRLDDVPTLALGLAQRIRPGTDPLSWLDDRTLGVLSRYHWPGNVRELRNVLERLAAIPDLDPGLFLPAGGTTSGAPDGLPAGLEEMTYHEAKDRILDVFERRYVEALLQREDGVVARAAQRAGVPRQTFFRLIRKHGLRGS